MIVRNRRYKALADELFVRLVEDRDSLNRTVTLPVEVVWQVIDRLETAARSTNMERSGASVTMFSNASAH